MRCKRADVDESDVSVDPCDRLRACRQQDGPCTGVPRGGHKSCGHRGGDAPAARGRQRCDADDFGHIAPRRYLSGADHAVAVDRDDEGGEAVEQRLSGRVHLGGKGPAAEQRIPLGLALRADGGAGSREADMRNGDRSRTEGSFASRARISTSAGADTSCSEARTSSG